MLNPEDRHAIEDLFDRLAEAARRTGPRDAEAEALIRRRIAEHPAAPYYMAQTILVQEAALREARERVAELEQKRTPGPWERHQAEPAHARGGGFLAGAAQTALGVTGGFLLGSAIASLFTGEAQAAEPEAPPADEPGGWDDGGGDWGGFDIGGDF